VFSLDGGGGGGGWGEEEEGGDWPRGRQGGARAGEIDDLEG